MRHRFGRSCWTLFRIGCIARRPPVSEDVIRRHSEALTWLSRVASGMEKLPSEMAVLSNSALGLTVETGGPGRAMTRDSLEDL